MSEARPAIEYVIENEGPLTDDPDDPGGITNWGITLNDLREMPGRQDAGAADIRALTRTEAQEIYRALYWDRQCLNYVRDQAIATKLLDLMVNQGLAEGTRIAQRACNALQVKPPLVVDGDFGPVTRMAVNGLSRTLLMPSLIQEGLRSYLADVAARPKMEKFLLGWMRRLSRTP